MKKLLLIIVCTLFLSNSIYAQDNDNQKLLPIIHEPYTTSLYEGGKFYFEKSTDINFPINFALEYCKNNEIVKVIVDRYESEGADIIEYPERNIDIEVMSLFFHKLKGEDYAFVIIRRGVTHRAIGVQGDDYRLYAYSKNKEGLLELDKNIKNDNNLSGIEGMVDWKDTHFKYKTVREVKKYLKQHYD